MISSGGRSFFLNIRTSEGRKRVKLRIKPEEEVAKIKTGYMSAVYPMSGRPDTLKGEPPKIPPGLKIPDIVGVAAESREIDESELLGIDVKYPLIPENPPKGSRIFAYAHIFFDSKANEAIYRVVEPKLTEDERKSLHEIKEYIQEKVDVNFSQVRRKNAVGYITKIFDNSIPYFKKNFTKETYEVLRYYVLRDFIGLEVIEPLLRDKYIEDISCDGVGIPIYVYHRDPRLGSIKTDIVFDSKEDLDYFVNKISERCGRSISVAKPLLDGTLPDGSRVQATLGTDIARHGSNFTIRMFSEKPLTPTDIIKTGTMDLKTMAYCWYLIENGSSFLISGGTATGKTTILNVLSLFIKPQMKIISIEDTAELRLPHPHWVPEVARTPISEGGKVDMFELLRESLRQRPDYIIVGEVRGKEAYVLFQQMAIGHPGISTIHSDSFQKLLDRLTSPPISLPANLLQSLDVILFLKRIKKERKYIRKCETALEVVGYDRKNKLPITNDVFHWDSRTDNFEIVGDSVLLKRLSDKTGLSEMEVQKEIRKRATVLEWAVNKDIRDYRKVAKVINLFYASPDYLLERIEGSI